MPTYVYDHKTDSMVEVFRAPSGPSKFPAISRDYAPFKSPLGTGWIDGKYARREHMKRHDLREVDPSEKPKRPVEPEYVKDWREGKGIIRSKPE